MLCWRGDRIQFKFINLLVNPILKVWKKWIEFWGGWLIFHSWNIYHIFQSISRAVHSSYRSIKWYGGRGIFNQGLAAPPAKLPAILSVLKGHEGEFFLQNNTVCPMNSTTIEVSKSSPPFLPKLWIKRMKKISFCVSCQLNGTRLTASCFTIAMENKGVTSSSA